MLMLIKVNTVVKQLWAEEQLSRHRNYFLSAVRAVIQPVGRARRAILRKGWPAMPNEARLGLYTPKPKEFKVLPSPRQNLAPEDRLP
ncbi:hypothetical protein EVAR_67974_1 [Eumeta japonica]|uniref:Uncharacterized protein n=1 Tax=Eumeta variegata TaxID=151549 RepID=A0A4C1T4V0_EUMVA|nr:hypothetical protein EVAR_67974_1 [Eumeta japonica]